MGNENSRMILNGATGPKGPMVQTEERLWEKLTDDRLSTFRNQIIVEPICAFPDRWKLTYGHMWAVYPTLALCFMALGEMVEKHLDKTRNGV